MSSLNDEDLESISKGLDDSIEAVLQVEQVYGVVQCNECSYWGRMDGWIEPNDVKFIKFVCPECNSIELVKNPEVK
jgi:Zn finger protein HypA/HybF involved in hydrogenase expression